MWSIHDLSFLKPARSFLMFSSTASESLLGRIWHSSLLVRQISVMLLQFPQLLRSPFVGSLCFPDFRWLLCLPDILQYLIQMSSSFLTTSLQRFCAYLVVPWCLFRFQLLSGLFHLFHCNRVCGNVNVRLTLRNVWICNGTGLLRTVSKCSFHLLIFSLSYP